MSKKRICCDKESFENRIDFEKLHLNSRLSDVNFLFEAGKNTAEHVPAHKMLLSGQSDVFAAMFYGELKEEDDVIVTDATIDAFKEFLQFFYLKRVHLTIENVAEVMKLGHKYKVSKCVDVCGRFLKAAVREDNACVALSLAILYDQPELQECCEEFIAKRSSAVFKSKSFLECDKNVLAQILRLDLQLCPETVIFEACMSWVKAKSKQNVVTKQLIQEHLGELFYEIRFTSMTMEEFDALSTKHDYAFSPAEYKDIFHVFASSKKASSELFNENPRTLPWNVIAVCDRKMPQSHKETYYFNWNKPTKFETNHPILLRMLVFAKICIHRQGAFHDLETEFPIKVKILEAVDSNTADVESKKKVADFKIKLLPRKETSITLPAPVLIRPRFYYEIHFNPEQETGNQIFYSCGGLKTEVQMANNVNIKFHGDREERVGPVNLKRVERVGRVNLVTAFGFSLRE